MDNGKVYSNSFLAMENRCDVVLANVEQKKAEQIFQLVKKEVEDIELSFNRFLPHSSIAEINSFKKDLWIELPDEIWDILTICYDFYQMSNGAFDITVTPLIDLWKDVESPGDEEIQKARNKSGFDKVEFDFDNRKIKFIEDEIQFDFGAIEKGIALDTLKPILIDQGIVSAILSCGESSILAIGAHPNGENWPLGIRNNYRINEFVHYFSAKDECVTTSGSILYSDESVVERRNHIISPATGLTVSENKTISVKSESAIMGEFLSTTWMILPENDRLILSEKLRNIEILEVEYFKNDFKTKLTIL